jgi:hypothetical protein
MPSKYPAGPPDKYAINIRATAPQKMDGELMLFMQHITGIKPN